MLHLFSGRPIAVSSRFESLGCRVNISSERTYEVSESIRSIKQAQDSLYDGIVISASDNLEYMRSLKMANQETPVMVLGALESYASIGDNTLSHVGEREADVGRLAGKTMRDAGMKVGSIPLSATEITLSRRHCV